MADLHDIAILGRTAAGCAAAAHLAAGGHDVLVLDAPCQAVECPLHDWVGRGFFSMAELPDALAKQCGATSFRQVTYHSADLAKHTEYRSRVTAGRFLHPTKLIRALHDHAVAAGATIRRCRRRPKIRLAEDEIRLDSASPVRARLLLIAQASPGQIVRELSLPARVVPQSPLTISALDVPITKAAAANVRGPLHIVAAHERTEMGAFFVDNATLHLRIVSTSPAAGSRTRELSAMVTALQQRGLLPGDLSLAKARGAFWRPPAGVALELETHVAKRCLLMGTAGGFAEAVTGQTLTASVRSALVAAKIASEALGSDRCQDALMRFKNSWRRSLASFIRPPNTSLPMLLPLLFVNRRMVARFTAALLEGKDI